MYNIFELQEKSLDDLKMIATELGIDDENRDRTQLIYDIIDHQVDHPDIKKPSQPKKQKQKKNDKPEPKKQAPEAPVSVEKINEKMPVDVLPLVYYYGDGGFMLVATPRRQKSDVA